MWPATFDHFVFRRTPKLVRQSDPVAFHLSLLLRGEGEAAWGRRQAAYGIRDFHINCFSRSCEITTGPEPVTIVGVEIPRTLVALPTGHADQAIGRRMPGREGTGALRRRPPSAPRAAPLPPSSKH